MGSFMSRGAFKDEGKHSVLHIIDHGDATTGSQLLGLGSVVAVLAQQEQMISSI